MLRTLLKGAGPLLPVLLQKMLRKSLSEIDSLYEDVQPKHEAPLILGPLGHLSEIVDDDFLVAIDKERVAYGASSVVSSIKAIITGPVMTALFTGPVIASLLAIGKIVTGHQLIVISAMLLLIPLVLEPVLKLILAGPALLLGALNLGAFIVTHAIVGVAFSAFLIAPAISIIFHNIIS